ncbi:MAG: hypothetical protein QGG83_00435 [Candidatus Woesearchaeota archaeon]|jgi:hypothetical protein|nr:hypothetical protein [Candidatus Woesearchaeota archaeon]MDP7180875.1 hypothetical protein [Candidatus Woesearchaeota archaeon]
MKAQTHQQMMLLMLAVVAIVLLGGFTNVLLGATEEKSKREACKLGITVAAGGQVLSFGERITRLPCERNNLNFDDEDEKTVVRELAKRLHLCALMIGEGKKNWPGSPYFSELLGGKNLCLICDIVSFNKKNPKPDFLTHLRSRRPRGQELTYQQYFMSLDNLPHKFATFIDVDIDPKETYAIYAVGSKKNKAIKWAGTIDPLRPDNSVEQALIFHQVKYLHQNCDEVLN